MPTLIEKHLNYVVNAITSAQRRQIRLWEELDANRDSKGIIPLDDPLLEDYCEAARMTASLMIDIEMVRDEYFAAGGKSRPRKKAAKKTAAKKTAAKKKTARKTAGKTTKKATRKKAVTRKAAPRPARKKAAAKAGRRRKA